MKTRRTQLRGDIHATPEKARALLELATAELKALPPITDPTYRMRLQQIANKPWLAVSAGADAYLCATEGRSAKGAKTVKAVYKTLSTVAAGDVNSVYAEGHIMCHYQDERELCNRDTVETAIHRAGQAVNVLARRLSRARSRGKARMTCRVGS
jgi:hypothetical protein